MRINISSSIVHARPGARCTNHGPSKVSATGSATGYAGFSPCVQYNFADSAPRKISSEFIDLVGASLVLGGRLPLSFEEVSLSIFHGSYGCACKNLLLRSSRRVT